MIAYARTLSPSPWPFVEVTLDGRVGQNAYGEIANAVFGLAECSAFRRLFLTGSCRGVTASRLGHVLVHGIDVTPADSPIYVSGLDKAMEYGEWPKLLLVFNPKRLDHTFRELSVTDPTRAELKHTFPTEVVSKDGTTVWFSRLNPDDPRLGPGYEAAYARWVPGDPRLALVALVLVQHPSYGSSLDVDAALATAANAAPPREES